MYPAGFYNLVTCYTVHLVLLVAIRCILKRCITYQKPCITLSSNYYVTA